MNKVKIGKDFEREAFRILQTMFDSVEWLSKKTKSSFDFKCMKAGKIYFGDAKLINTDNKPNLKFTQREADFIIAKIKDKILFINKKDFSKFINIEKKSTHSFPIDDDIWKYLNQMKEAGESFSEVLRRKLKINIKPAKTKTDFEEVRK